MREMRGVRLYQNVLPKRFFEWLTARIQKEIKGGGTSIFWFSFASPPRNSIEVAILRFLRPIVRPGPSCLGAEWWIRAEAINDSKALHFDKDEKLFEKHGKLVHPKHASIFYLNSSGGPTLVLDQISAPNGKTKIPSKAKRAVHLYPRPNRFAVFNGDFYHGVLPMKEPPTDKKLRMTLLVNFWGRVPSLAVPSSSNICASFPVVEWKKERNFKPKRIKPQELSSLR